MPVQMVLHTVLVLFIWVVTNDSIQPNTVFMAFCMACRGATMSAPMTVNTLTTVSRMELTAVPTAALMPFHRFVKNVLTPFHAVWMVVVMLVQMPERNEVIAFHTVCAVVLIVPQRFVKNSPSPLNRAFAPPMRSLHAWDSHETNVLHI